MELVPHNSQSSVTMASPDEVSPLKYTTRTKIFTRTTKCGRFDIFLKARSLLEPDDCGNVDASFARLKEDLFTKIMIKPTPLSKPTPQVEILFAQRVMTNGNIHSLQPTVSFRNRLPYKLAWDMMYFNSVEELIRALDKRTISLLDCDEDGRSLLYVISFRQRSQGKIS